MPWILDLDGVVWRGDTPVPGSVAAIGQLRSAGQRVLFLTNNSSSTVGAYLQKMVGMGLSCDASDLCTSAQAAALLVEPGEKVLVCGGAGIVEALENRGVDCVRDFQPGITAVVAGWHRDFSFDRLTQAFLAVKSGARLIGTNDDQTYPTADGELPGGGSIVAAIAYASETTPEFAGKPHSPAASLVFGRLGWDQSPTKAQRSELLMVGDRPSTDGLMGRTLGGRFGLVLSGVVCASDLPVTPTPDVIADDLAGLVAAELTRQ